jgi:hypothetical protein
VFSAKDAGENIRPAMGNHSRVVGPFWTLIPREIHDAVFLQKLKTESHQHVANRRQGHMLECLESNLEHFSPARVVVDTSEQVSSRIDAFFNAYKNLIRHEVLPLVDAVHEIRILAHGACSKIWFSGSRPSIQDSVRTPSEQAWNVRRDETSS